MRIVLITNYWLRSSGGGVLEYNRHFVNALKKENVDIKVIFREGMDQRNYKVSKKGFSFVLAAYNILLKTNPDVILAQGGWWDIELSAILYKIRKLHTKTLVIFHTQYPERFSLLKRVVYYILTNSFDKVGFVSKALEKNVREVAGLKIKKNTFILYAGAPTKKVWPEEINKFQEKYKISKKKIILLGQSLTAHKLKYKGAKILIQSVKILKDKGYPVILILTRKGKYSDELKKFARKLNVEKEVILTGDVENPYVPLALCDIYTHITLGEGGLSVALLEAMAMGKPIIATPAGGIPEAIKDGKNGLLVDPEPEKIANAIEMLINDKRLRERLGSEAKKTAEEKFTWAKTVLDFKKIIDI